MSVLLRNSESVTISHQAMLYLGLHPWESTRELEQHLDTIRHRGTIEIHNVVDNVETIYALEDQTGVNILSAEDYRIELCAEGACPGRDLSTVAYGPTAAAVLRPSARVERDRREKSTCIKRTDK